MVEEIIYFAFGFQGKIHHDWEVLQQVAGVLEKMRECIFNGNRMQRKWTRSGVRLKPLKTCLEWCTLPSRLLWPKGSITMTNSIISWRPSFQTQACGGISWIYNWSGRAQVTMGNAISGHVILVIEQSRLNKPWRASQWAVFLQDFCIKLLPWVPFLTSLSDGLWRGGVSQMNPFFFQIRFRPWFITAL